jgi:hypothetical protein
MKSAGAGSKFVVSRVSGEYDAQGQKSQAEILDKQLRCSHSWRQQMRIRTLILLPAVLLLAGIAVTSARAADEPAAGVWKVNLAKSKYNPGPAPQSSTITITIDNNTETYAAEGVDGSGNAVHGSFTAKLDGTDAPVTGNPYGDTISVKRHSPTHYVVSIKKGGAVTMTVHVVVAADGKSRTATYSGKSPKGEKEHDVVFYDKQ